MHTAGSELQSFCASPPIVVVFSPFFFYHSKETISASSLHSRPQPLFSNSPQPSPSSLRLPFLMGKPIPHLLSIPLLFLLLNPVKTENDDIKLSLIAFLKKLSPNNPQIDHELNWTTASDLCLNSWRGVSCNTRTHSVRSIALESLDLDGSIDFNLLCISSSLVTVSLKNNSLTGDLTPAIASCSKLTHLYLNNNRLSGSLPSSLSQLKKLKRLVISNNNFSGDLPPDLPKISSLITFLVENNHFQGTIPEFNLSNFQQFNVSVNSFSGPLPESSEKFTQTSFMSNSGLCGKPLQTICPSLQPETPPEAPRHRKTSASKAIMVSGYVLLGLTAALSLMYILLRKKKISPEDLNLGKGEKKLFAGRSPGKPWNERQSAEYSISTAAQSAVNLSTSMVLLKKVGEVELRFEDLLKAPAKLLGRGRFGNLYKVVVGDSTELVVKRIKDWTVSGEGFEKRMVRMDQARHPNVLPVTAFYCSKQEKLVVYEYQRNGSLFKLLHDNKDGRPFNWESRLNVAARVSAGLAFMHKSLASAGGAGHGNLKSSNVLLSSTMDPLISEYGLTAFPAFPDPDSTSPTTADPFSPSDDIHALGIILLELLTGKPSQGFNLAQWVNAVVREEWTVEVFDRALLAEAESSEREDRMVRLLQVALKCIEASPPARPSMEQVVAAVERLKFQENDERSFSFDGFS